MPKKTEADNKEVLAKLVGARDAMTQALDRIRELENLLGASAGALETLAKSIPGEVYMKVWAGDYKYVKVSEYCTSLAVTYRQKLGKKD